MRLRQFGLKRLLNSLNNERERPKAQNGVSER